MKCTQRNREANVYSGMANRIFGFGNQSLNSGFLALGTNKIDCFEGNNSLKGGYNLPAQADIQRNSDYLQISGNPITNTFSLEVLEIYAVKTY